MQSKRYLFIVVVSAILIAIPLGCRLFGFVPMVVIGDSLSAGFQNDSLLDSQQPHGWASLVAQQSGLSLPLPSIASPGVPPVLELVSLGPPPVVQTSSGISLGRTDPEQQPFDLAVPGHTLADVISDAPKLIPTSQEDIITDLVLGLPLGNTKSQMNEAIALRPATLFIWAGSDDALQADEAGTPAAMTPVSTFASEFEQLISTIHSQTSSVLIVANVPDVTVVPYLTPASVVIAEVAQQTGLPAVQVVGLLGIEDGDLINATGLSQVEAAIAAIKGGQPPSPLTDAGYLDANEITQVRSNINQYNAVIAQQVAAVGGILVDIHSYLAQLAENGVTINNYHATTGFLSGLFSLDGVHPTNTGYALLANQFIAAANAKLKTGVPAVNVSQVAASDPLFGPNIKPESMVVHVPLVAAQQTDRVLHHP